MWKIRGNDFANSLLVSLAKEIGKGQKLSVEKITNQVYKDCFDDTNPEKEIWKKRIKERVAFLIESDQEEDDSLLMKILSDACCDYRDEKSCLSSCPTGAISLDESGKYKIDEKRCVECTLCVESCIAGSIAAHSNFAQVAKLMFQRREYPLYAILAPSFVGQFGEKVTPEILKGALKGIGFYDVHEVAMASDAVTRFEAEEFVKRMRKGDSFMITSCCCPSFIKLVEKIRPKVKSLVSETISPMIVMGKVIKEKNPSCKVVFIGPCLAKKAEIKDPRLKGIVDYVLTFKEMMALFEAGNIPLDGSLGEENLEEASFDGRIYARTGGVSQSIAKAVQEIDPTIKVKAVHGDGIKDCSRLLKELEEGTLDANFMEGMACIGGCVGGPGTLISKEEGKKNVEVHASEAVIGSSFENNKISEWDIDFEKK